MAKLTEEQKRKRAETRAKNKKLKQEREEQERKEKLQIGSAVIILSMAPVLNLIFLIYCISELKKDKEINKKIYKKSIKKKTIY